MEPDSTPAPDQLVPLTSPSPITHADSVTAKTEGRHPIDQSTRLTAVSVSTTQHPGPETTSEAHAHVSVTSPHPTTHQDGVAEQTGVQDPPDEPTQLGGVPMPTNQYLGAESTPAPPTTRSVTTPSPITHQDEATGLTDVPPRDQDESKEKTLDQGLNMPKASERQEFSQYLSEDSTKDPSAFLL